MNNRLLLYKINKYIEHKNAIVITGARQVGKTSLLQIIYDQLPENQKLWFDFENPLHQKIFEAMDYDEIYKNLINRGISEAKRKYIFIDEIQNYPEITRVIKYLIDHYKIKFFVTGSSSFYMKNLFPESLSGRKFIFNLYPLNFQEYLYFKGRITELAPTKNKLDLHQKNLSDFSLYKTEFNEYLNWGGFPEVALTRSNEEKRLILDNIFKSFFEKDILQLSHYQDVKEIRDLILLLTRRASSKLDITRIASELGVNRYKIYTYLEFLQATFLVRLIPIYSKSIDRKVAGGKKVYFIDNGLLNQIAKISEGALFENCVANILSEYGELSYYQTRSNKEIDFILNSEIAFEVKIIATKSDLNQLQQIAKKLNIQEYYLVSKEFIEKIDRVIYPHII